VLYKLVYFIFVKRLDELSKCTLSLSFLQWSSNVRPISRDCKLDHEQLIQIHSRVTTRVNEDCHVHSYIQQQNTSITLEDILVYSCSSVKTMDCIHPSSLRSVYAKTAVFVNSRGRGLRKSMLYCPESENGLFWDSGSMI